MRLTLESGSGAYTNEIEVFGYEAPQVGLKKASIKPLAEPEQAKNEEIKVYPTFFSETINLKIENETSCNYRISFYNMNGKIVFEDRISHTEYTSKSYSVASFNLASGIYLAKIRDENKGEAKTFKLVKQ